MSLLPRNDILCLVTTGSFLLARRRLRKTKTLVERTLATDLTPDAILNEVGQALAELPDAVRIHAYLPSSWFVHWEVPWLTVAAGEPEYLAVADNLLHAELGIMPAQLQFSLSPPCFEESRVACGIRREWVDALRQSLQARQHLVSLSPLYALQALSPSHAGALSTEADSAVLYQRDGQGLHVYCRRLPNGPGKPDALRHFIRRYAPALPSRWQNSDPALQAVIADPLLGKPDTVSLPGLVTRHSALQHNTLVRPDLHAPQQRLPWLMIATAAAFLLLTMSQTRELTRETVALKYQVANRSLSDHPASSTQLPEATRTLITQVGAQLRFPWDDVFNTFYQPIMAPQLISLTADNASATVDLRLQSVNESQFWHWFNLTRTNPALISLDVLSTSQGDIGPIHDVRSRWRRR